MRDLPFTRPDDFVISDADRAVIMGSGELKPCPFCGQKPIVGGRVNPKTKLVVYEVMCISNTCQAMTFCCERTASEARRQAVERWNRRVQL